ncbi:MAG: ATP-grasp domain-containing protein, partial [Chloroflexota bacterium]
QHIEEAGVHSGDSACVLPPYKIGMYHIEIIRDYTRRIGQAMGVKGLFNIQFAVQDDVVYVLEVNPRASRTVPFVSKATGHPLARYAVMIAAGKTLEAIGFTEEPPVDGFFVKEAVLPFVKFPGVDALLGPEMRSTGEVMGQAQNFGHAFVKAQMSTNVPLPTEGNVFISVNDRDKGTVMKLARDLHEMGFKLLSTAGTARALELVGLPVQSVNKISEASPHIGDLLLRGDIDLIINTPLGSQAYDDGRHIRSAAQQVGVPIITTMSAAAASVQGMRALQKQPLSVRSLQAHHS